ncbi:MAG TPA: PQQ-dependent sugar dehydrogenase [Anaerolineales bacterium]|nr:PQQ-dependent sugar dehydrogenase [Anaerolineales bacterium]
MRKSYRFAALIAISILTSSLISAGAPVTVASATLPPAVVLKPVVTGLTQPVFVTHAGDGSNRLFIVQQTGQIRVFKNGSLLSTPFLNVSGVAGFTNGGSEQGLLGLAFDPNYATNQTFYVTYTITTGNATFPYGERLVRYQASTTNPDVAVPSSASLILSYQKKFTNHNGGMIAFGPDGFLYWGTGDGGSGGDPDGNAQNIDVLLGKILRLDVQTAPPAGKTYVIPPSNPFFGDADPAVRQEIWAYGLRNPWRWSFDRSTGDLFIGDVGQNIEEEVDFQPASSTGGENYGWNVLEGNRCFKPSSGCTQPAHYVAPVRVYDHGTNDSFGCAVTGGYVFRDPASPTLQGVYFFGDYCSGRLLALVHNSNSTWSSKVVTDTAYNISSFGQGEDGALYLTDLTGGQVIRISQRTLVTAPPFLSEAVLDGTVRETTENSGVGGPLNATAATLHVGDGPLRRQWRAVLSFNTPSLPDRAVITMAHLRIKQASISSSSPFGTLGSLVADMGVPRFGPSAGLEKPDFQAGATKTAAATFNPTPSSGWYTGAVATANLGLINRTGRTQFRLRFTLDDNNDPVANFAEFFSGDTATAADRPQLVIQYYVP